MGVSSDMLELVGSFTGVSLSELDERASLMRRIDNKYAVPHDAFLELLRRLKDEHDVLDMDGRREFAYETVYFETPDLRCYRDHVEGRFPRFKARTRCYRDTDSCVFEVKIKSEDGETDKRQVEHPPDQADELIESARRCLDEALEDGGIDVEQPLEPRLRTRFQRITLAARDSPARLTCDIGVRLAGTDGTAVILSRDLVLVETKSEDGHSPADRTLEELGQEQISLSKYRVGMSLAGGAPGDEPQPGSEYFS